MKNKLAEKFIKSTGWQVASQIYSMLLSLVIGAITARYLGPSNYGIIGYGQSFVSIFTSISTLGMGGVVIQKLVSTPERKDKIIGTAFVMRLLSSFICIIMTGVLVRIMEPGDKLLQVITLIQSVALVIQAGEAFGYWFQAKLDYKVISIGTIVAYTAVGIWRIVMLVSGTTVVWFSAASCVHYLASSLVIIALYIKRGDSKIRFDLSVCKEIFLQSYPFILSGLAISLYTQVDKVMLGHMMNETTVGYYTAATSVAILWEFVPNAVINSSKMPVFDAKGKGDEETYEKRLSYLLCGISVMSILVGIGMMLLGGLAIRILYGEAYMSAKDPLMILIWSTGFAMIGTARGNTWLIAEKLNKYSFYCVVISSVANIILNWLMIPSLGMIGAAVATLASQIITAFLAPALFKETRKFVSLYIRSWKISLQGVAEYAKNVKKSN